VRTARDLDVIGPSPDDVDRPVPAVETALTAAGLAVRREPVSLGFVGLTVSDGDDATKLDLAADARIPPTEAGQLGPVLSAEELGADKLLARSTVPTLATSSMCRPARPTPARARGAAATAARICRPSGATAA
jgi:hypothetical protein